MKPSTSTTNKPPMPPASIGEGEEECAWSGSKPGEARRATTAAAAGVLTALLFKAVRWSTAWSTLKPNTIRYSLPTLQTAPRTCQLQRPLEHVGARRAVVHLEVGREQAGVVPGLGRGGRWVLLDWRLLLLLLLLLHCWLLRYRLLRYGPLILRREGERGGVVYGRAACESTVLGGRCVRRTPAAATKPRVLTAAAAVEAACSLIACVML
jgi:hypothetical protein